MGCSRIGFVRMIQFKYHIYPENTEPKGRLIEDKACQALFYYAILCSKSKEKVGSGPESQMIVIPAGYDSSTIWLDKYYLRIAKTMSIIYGVDLNDIMKYWPLVDAEFERLGLPLCDEEIRNPKRIWT